MLARCARPLPVYVLADEQHSRCLTATGYRPTIVSGRMLWHLGYTTEASAAALPQAYQEFQRAAVQHEPSDRGTGLLTDGVDSTAQRLRTPFPGVRLGPGLRHALRKRPKTSAAMASPVRQALRTQCHTVWYRARQRRGWRVLALGQRCRRLVDRVTTTAGTVNGACVRRWFQDKKAGWYAVLADPQLPVTSPLLDPARHAIERTRFAMQGFQHPDGSQRALLTGLAHLDTLVPSPRRAPHAGPCGVAVAGGTVPTRDWFLNLQILTSGGVR